MYGGTKEELERLLEDAEAYKASLGEIVDYDISNFADITEAIGAVQEQMGLAGSAAGEAADTIEGSVNSMKAAWQNMMVGIADENADFDVLLNNLITSVGTAAENILPRIRVVLEGIANLVVELAPTLVDTAVDLLTQLGQYLIENVPVLLRRVPELITWLVTTISENAPKLFEVAGQLLVALGEGLIEMIPDLLENVPTIVESVAEGIGDMADEMVQAGKDLIKGLALGLVNAIPDLLKSVGEVASSMLNKVKSVFRISSPSKVMAEIGGYLAQGVGVGWTEQMASVSDTIGSSLSDGLESRMVNAYTRMRAAMSDGMSRLSGDIAVQARGASNYTTNHNTTTEGDFIIQIEKIVNDGKGTVAGMMEEFEFIRRQKAAAKGGA